jgi:hypothetical protein
MGRGRFGIGEDESGGLVCSFSGDSKHLGRPVGTRRYRLPLHWCNHYIKVLQKI